MTGPYPIKNRSIFQQPWRDRAIGLIYYGMTPCPDIRRPIDFPYGLKRINTLRGFHVLSTGSGVTGKEGWLYPMTSPALKSMRPLQWYSCPKPYKIVNLRYLTVFAWTHQAMPHKSAHIFSHLSLSGLCFSHVVVSVLSCHIHCAAWTEFHVVFVHERNLCIVLCSFLSLPSLSVYCWVCQVCSTS